ncbi:MAG TPA: DoxX family protein, partial [Longimicrobiales bacterium]
MRWTYDVTREKPGLGLWLAQAALAGLFAFAGVFKLLMPAAALAQVTGLSGSFMHFIAACEVLGAVGLVLPGVLRIHEELTPTAAAGLVIIMIGAVVATLATMPASWAVLPLVVGAAAAFIAYGRWR